jgi:hypothetical protein
MSGHFTAPAVVEFKATFVCMNIARFKASAYCRSFVITDRFDYMTDEPHLAEDCCRRGYLVHRPNIVYHFIINEGWDFDLSVDYTDVAPSSFGGAQRVVHLPVIISGPMLLHGSHDWQESSFDKLSVGAGSYSLFSKGWNLGLESERYEWIICPLVDRTPRVLSGGEFLY